MENRRKVMSWALYDWANSAFAITVMSAFFPLFLKQYWSDGADATLTTFRLGLANSIGSIVIALLSPILGAIADQSGTRKRYLIFFAAMAIVMTGGLQFAARGDWPPHFPEVAKRAYTLGDIKKWLRVFLVRFFELSQYKRSALPNGPKVVSGGNLSPRGDWRAPSDGNARIWLEELEGNVPD